MYTYVYTEYALRDLMKPHRRPPFVFTAGLLYTESLCASALHYVLSPDSANLVPRWLMVRLRMFPLAERESHTGAQ